jgi:hypothetical protein
MPQAKPITRTIRHRIYEIDHLVEWAAYTAEERATMFFDVPCGVRNAPEAEGLRLTAQL